MKKRFSDEKIIRFLKEAAAGTPIKELCRRHGFSDASFYLWRRRFGYRRLHVLLEREGFEANHKRV